MKTISLNVIGFNPFDYRNHKDFKFFFLRGIFKLMLFVHCRIIFPTHFAPTDIGKIENLKDSKEIFNKRIGNCGHYSILFNELCNSIGYKSRLLYIHERDGIQGHCLNEIWCEFNSKWFVVDAMYLVFGLDYLGQEKIIICYSAYDIHKNVNLFVNKIPQFLSGISIKTWKKLWECLEINLIDSNKIKMKNFKKRFYKDG